jgi:hypothetical protein
VNTRTDAIAYWMSQGKTRDEAKVLTFGWDVAMGASPVRPLRPSQDPNFEHLGACRVADPAAPEAADRILLVGEDNPLSSWPENALVCWPENCAGHRLQSRIFGLPELEYLALWRTNLCRGGWQVKFARERARDLQSRAPSTPEDAPPWTVIVMLGAKVAEAFRKTTCATEEWSPYSRHLIYHHTDDEGQRHELTLVYLPHPSGRNAARWAMPGRVDETRRIMRELAPELGWGSV